MLSVSRGRLLRDLTLAVVYISLRRHAHAHCALRLDIQGTTAFGMNESSYTELLISGSGYLHNRLKDLDTD